MGSRTLIDLSLAVYVWHWSNPYYTVVQIKNPYNSYYDKKEVKTFNTQEEAENYCWENNNVHTQ